MERGEKTDAVFEEICFGAPTNPQSAEDVVQGVEQALQLEEEPIFLEGVAQRLSELGFPCNADEAELIEEEVKRRYKVVLGEKCKRPVTNWLKGGRPGVVSRENHYSLCMALEMNVEETTAFFVKHFLTIPFNCKSRVDAIFLYVIYHHKPYRTALRLLKETEDAETQVEAHTETVKIWSTIMEIQDDETYIEYLKKHCYGNKQQYQKARAIIIRDVEKVKQFIIHESEVGATTVMSTQMLNSMTISELLGYCYQNSDHIKRSHEKRKVNKLPARFTESLPNDVTLGKILRGEEVSYETLRKTLMLLEFYDFYHIYRNEDEASIYENLLDFHDALNDTLVEVGFSHIYERHPFDCLLLYCAKSYDPISTLRYVTEWGNKTVEEVED